MADPLVLSFRADTSKAQSALAGLAASVAGNMASIGVSMLGGAEKTNSMGGTLAGLASNASRAAQSVSTDVSRIGSAVVTAASRDRATVEGVVTALVGSVVTSNTAIAGLKTGATGSATAIKTVVQQLPGVSALVAGLLGFAAVSVVFEGFTAAANAASAALEGTAKIGSDAARLGTSTTFLQTYLAQARALRVEADDLRKSLDMARAAFTVKQGEGGEDARNESTFTARLRQQAAAGNIDTGSVDRFTAAVGTEAQFRVALDLITQMQAKGRDLAALDLASKLFPPEIVERIRQGTLEIDRLRKTMDTVKNPNLVLLSPDEIVRAQELQRRLAAAEALMARASAEWNRELARAGEQLKEDAISWKETVAAGSQLLLQAYQSLKGAGAAWVRDGAGLSSGGGDNLAAQLGATARTRTPPPTPEAQQSLDALNKLRAGLGNRTLIEEAQAATRAMTEGVRTDTSKPLVTAPKTAGRSSASESLDAVETLINQIQKASDTARAELETVKATNVERERAVALAKAEAAAREDFQKGKRLSAALDDDERSRVLAAAESWQTYKDRVMDAQQALRQAAEQARYFGQIAADSIGDAILEGKSFSDILGTLQKQLARAALQAVMTGQGPLASLLGTATKASAGTDAVGGLSGVFSSGLSGLSDLFRQGPGFSGVRFAANGGPISAGRAYTVGEAGREIFVPGESGRMYPVARNAASSGFGSGTASPAPRPIQVQMTVHAADAPSFLRSESQVTAALFRAVQRGARSS